MTVVLQTIPAVRQWVRTERSFSNTLGLVPTMGFLHEGHLSLIRRARQNCDLVAASIFVNPLQFGPGEDFDRYPRSFDRDFSLLEQEKVDAIFHPPVNEMYPDESATNVNVGKLGETLDGLARPGHFRGVATVIVKLFNIFQPDRAYFGQKDAQQAVIVRRLVQDLNFPLQVEVCPTVREADGLAMSSRNDYLSPQDRAQAPILFRSLQRAESLIRSGVSDAASVERKIREMICTVPAAELDYASVVDPNTLEGVLQINGRVLIAIAVRFGKTRLIDNIIVAPA